MSEVDISREAVEALADRYAWQDEYPFVANTILALRAALDRAEADRAAAVKKAWHDAGIAVEQKAVDLINEGKIQMGGAGLVFTQAVLDAAIRAGLPATEGE